jgi:hypothetical protein
VATMTAALAGRAMPAGTTGVAWAVAAAAGAVRESGAAAAGAVRESGAAARVYAG